MNKILCVLIGIAFTIGSCQNNHAKFTEINIIPQPEKADLSGSSYFVNKKTSISFDQNDANLLRAALRLQEILEKPLGVKVGMNVSEKKHNANSIKLSIDGNMADEAYVLSVCSDYVEIIGGTARGVYWGIQTLRQMMPENVEKDSVVDNFEIPCAVIYDAPVFSYRGMHLDVCRHFFRVAEVKNYIDLLAMHKFNTFHWHLTDDQGWRIEIKKYPELTQVGAWRDETVIGRNTGKYDSIRYGGYFTQDEVKEVVKYAEDRFITVIPEIEMPGHALAAITSYPELGCTGGPYKVATLWGVFDDVFCAGNDKTFEFFQGVIDEVCEMFPNSPYIHIGGMSAQREHGKNARNVKHVSNRNNYTMNTLYKVILSHEWRNTSTQRVSELLAGTKFSKVVWLLMPQ